MYGSGLSLGRYLGSIAYLTILIPYFTYTLTQSMTRCTSKHTSTHTPWILVGIGISLKGYVLVGYEGYNRGINIKGEKA